MRCKINGEVSFEKGVLRNVFIWVKKTSGSAFHNTLKTVTPKF